MKLQLKIDKYGMVHNLLTPDGEEIEGIAEIDLPPLRDDKFSLVTVKFYLTSGSLNLDEPG